MIIGEALVPADAILGIQSALFVPVLLFFYLFPNGRFVPRWTRYATLLVILFSPLFIHTLIYEWMPTTTPLGWSMIVAYLLLLGAGIYAQIYRYRRVASPVERQKTKWVVFGLVLTFFLLGVCQIPYAIVSQLPADSTHPWWVPLMGLVWWISLGILPISLAIAVMGFRLWDIDLILNRTLVYGTLTASIVAIYILLIAGLGTLLQVSGNLFISLLATALIAVLFQPWRQRLQGGVNRLMYGERDDPYAVVSRLGQRLEATLEPGAVLPAIVETVAQTLKLPYAGIALKEGDDFQIAAEYRSPALTMTRGGGPDLTSSALPDGVQVISLVHQSEVVGQLLITPRAPREGLNTADRHLLEQFALRAGIAVHALRLTRDLQHSRARLVTAREEERRRIRRDLHDGLGPVLASLAMRADNAREWTLTDPGQAEAAMVDITANAQEALQDIRRLVYDLRPPALDELGLIGALRQSAANFPNGLQIEIDAPEPLPPLSAAVEVAAYRIAQETLNNVVRHSHAEHCSVRVSIQDELRLEISDDGMGLPSGVRAGVGLISMRERAVELGGSCVIESRQGGGTQVLARLPLAKA